MARRDLVVGGVGSAIKTRVPLYPVQSLALMDLDPQPCCVLRGEH